MLRLRSNQFPFFKRGMLLQFKLSRSEISDSARPIGEKRCNGRQRPPDVWEASDGKQSRTVRIRVSFACNSADPNGNPRREPVDFYSHMSLPASRRRLLHFCDTSVFSLLWQALTPAADSG